MGLHASLRSFVDIRYAGASLLASLGAGLGSMLLSASTLPPRMRVIVGWDASALAFVALSWWVIARATPAETRERAALEDPGRRIVFFIALIAAAFSLFAAITALRPNALPSGHAVAWTTLTLAAVALSWFVTHTAFTFRYSHLYYEQEGQTRCFQFSGTDGPDDMDFAYFAFTVGMCFQVSDVTVSSSVARRTVLLHALISFLYNTTILALSLNQMTSLLRG